MCIGVIRKLNLEPDFVTYVVPHPKKQHAPCSILFPWERQYSGWTGLCVSFAAITRG